MTVDKIGAVDPIFYASFSLWKTRIFLRGVDGKVNLGVLKKKI